MQAGLFHRIQNSKDLVGFLVFLENNDIGLNFIFYLFHYDNNSPI